MNEGQKGTRQAFCRSAAAPATVSGVPTHLRHWACPREGGVGDTPRARRPAVRRSICLSRRRGGRGAPMYPQSLFQEQFLILRRLLRYAKGLEGCSRRPVDAVAVRVGRAGRARRRGRGTVEFVARRLPRKFPAFGRTADWNSLLRQKNSLFPRVGNSRATASNPSSFWAAFSPIGPKDSEFPAFFPESREFARRLEARQAFPDAAG